MVAFEPAPDPELAEADESVALSVDVDPAWGGGANRLVTTELLGTAATPEAPYENPDGSPLRITTDIRGEERETGDPFPGPIASPGEGSREFGVREWRGELQHPDVETR